MPQAGHMIVSYPIGMCSVRGLQGNHVSSARLVAERTRAVQALAVAKENGRTAYTMPYAPGACQRVAAPRAEGLLHRLDHALMITPVARIWHGESDAGLVAAHHLAIKIIVCVSWALTPASRPPASA